VRRFRKQADRVEASANLLYADVDGTIAFFTRGVLPQRSARFDPRLPLPGSGGAEPSRLATGRALPSLVRPRQGYLAQWDSKPIRGWSSGAQRELWGTSERLQGLVDRIEADRTADHAITPNDVAGYMRGVATSDVLAGRIAPYLRAAVEAVAPGAGDESRLRTAIDLIDAWLADGATLRADASGKIPYPGLTIYRSWRFRAQRAVFADELADHRRGLYYFEHATLTNWDDSSLIFTPDALFVRALEGSAAALPPSRDYFADVTTGTNAGRDAVLVAALREALDALTADEGTFEMTAWLTPRIDVRFFDDAASDLYFGPTIVERANRNAFDFVVELTPESTGRAVLAPGNSGFVPIGAVGSRNVNDQLPLYDAFAYRPWPLHAFEEPTVVEELPWP
jgi:penicillin amidase